MMLVLFGANASEPIASDAWLSVNGVHVAPPSNVCHTPPCAPPISQWFVLLGLTAMAETRPLMARVNNVAPIWPSNVGAGPKLVHVLPWTTAKDVRLAGETVCVSGG